MPYFDFAIISGDQRNTYLIPYLREKGYRVCAYQVKEDTKEEKEASEKAFRLESLEDTIQSAGVVVAGVPLKKYPEKYEKYLQSNQLFFAGGIDKTYRETFEKKKIQYFDFLDQESVRLANSQATAEGVVYEILKRKDMMFFQMSFFILGYGRCGKMIAEKLRNLKGKVAVFTTNENEKMEALLQGYQVYTEASLGKEKKLLEGFDFIINTIPVKEIVEKSIWKESNKYAKILDITGVSEKSWIIYLTALPGKYASRGMAYIYGEFISKQMSLLGKYKSNHHIL